MREPDRVGGGGGLDITAFGVNIIDLPPDYATSPHDEAETGQQELSVALRAPS